MLAAEGLRPAESASGALRLGTHVVLAGLAILALAPLWTTGLWYLSHEKIRYLVLLDLFRDAVLHGVWYPRLLPDLYGGYGYPTFCFYQPGLFFFALPFTLLPLGLHQAIYLALIALAYLGALGASCLGRELAGRTFGLFAAAWFLLTPYLYVDLYVRGDLSEWMSMLLCPWAVFWLLRLSRRLREDRPAAAAMCGCAASLFAVVVSHPAPPLALLPALSILALVLGWRERFGRALLARFGASAALALALSSPYWLGLLELRDYVAFERLTQEFYRPERHTVRIGELFSNRWGFAAASDDPAATDEMPVPLGALHFLFASLGAWFGRRSRVVVAAYAGSLVLLLLLLPPSVPLWERLGFLRVVQFPWRYLSVIATLQLVATLGLRGLLAGHPLRRAGALAAIVALGCWWYADQFALGGRYAVDPGEILETYHASIKRNSFRDFTAMNEFVPRTVRQPPEHPRDFDAPPIQLEGAGRIRAADGNHAHRLRYEVEHAAPAAVVIERLYLPGWRVSVNGRDVARAELEARLLPSGLIRVELPGSGTARVEAYYEGPPGGRLRLAAIAAALLAFSFLAFRERRR